MFSCGVPSPCSSAPRSLHAPVQVGSPFEGETPPAPPSCPGTWVESDSSSLNSVTVFALILCVLVDILDEGRTLGHSKGPTEIVPHSPSRERWDSRRDLESLSLPRPLGPTYRPRPNDFRGVRVWT